MRGTARVTTGDKVQIVHKNESIYVPIGSQHRQENPGKIDLELIEVQTGSYLGEDDIKRIQDDYNRSLFDGLMRRTLRESQLSQL